jgi:ligand-binding sensor domain-containing protein/GGDEF domain-containing protein
MLQSHKHEWVRKFLPAVLLLTIAISSVYLTVNAQELNSLKAFNADNPLSYQSVGTIEQDKEGFMWFGSQEGLHRFDGYTFKSYHHEGVDQNTLSSGPIGALLVDRTDNLWVGTRGGGLNLFRPSSQDFQRINSKTTDISLTNDDINALIEDSNGNIWIATENGLNILMREQQPWVIKQVFNQSNNPRSLTNNSVQTLLQVSPEHVWVGTNNGINVFDLQGNFVNTIALEKDGLSPVDSKLISVLYQQRGGDIWIGTAAGGLIKFDHLSNDLVHYAFDEKDATSLISNAIEAIYQDSSDRIWIATDKGLSIHHKTLNNFDRYSHVATDPNSLANNFVLTLFEDNNQMMWIGTFSGANRWDPTLTTFKQYNTLQRPTMVDSHISSFSQSNEQAIFFSTYGGGIYQLSLDNDKVTQLELNQAFKDLSVTKLLAEKDVLWVGTRSSGLYKVQLSTKKIVHYQHDDKKADSLSNNSITDIIKDNHANLWISTFYQGINRLNNNETFTRFQQTSPLSDKGPSTNNILQMMTDHQGYLWLATYGAGINRFDSASKTFKHILHSDDKADSLSADMSWIMYQDNEKNLWVGTQAAGLNVLTMDDQEKDNFSFTRLGLTDGMKSRTVYGINQDSEGNIWFSTNIGISRYSPKHKGFKHFGITHGLLDLEYNHGVVFRGLDNTLYFGSPKGFNSINPDTALNSLPAPKVHLTNILKLNEPMVFDVALAKLDALTFEHSDQVISFEYVGLNYVDPQSTRYRYRLLGFDSQWIDAGKLKRATYTNLPSGDYRFEVVAGNNDNIWSNPGRSLAITVKPAPWNTWWAYLLYTLLVAMALLTYSRMVNRKLLDEQQQKLLLTQQVEEKTQEFQSKNVELEHANKQLENAATTDKLTGVKSRRYLDIYIEQASRLMSQIHQNILPVQRSILPRLYLFMVRVNNIDQVSNSQLINLTDLLLYSRNPDDLVIRWSNDTFAIIGYEKERNARDLASRLGDRFSPIFGEETRVDMAYSFYPFNFEQPMALSWDQVSVITEFGLNQVSNNNQINWLGLYAPKVQPFHYLDALKLKDIGELGMLIDIRQG